MTAWYVTGDVRDVLAKMPDGSVDLVLTSPPFLALRSYLPADHPDKGREIGAEPTPGAFIDTLLDLTEEWSRVLAPHGSICVELGDTYSGSGGSGGDYNENGLRDGQPKVKLARKVSTAGTDRSAGTADARMPWKGERPGWPADKSLCLVPELYRVALVYGVNPLTGRETPRWRARNVVRWCRPNPPVGALGDKVRPATSDMVIACRTDEAGRRRYFDLDAIRTPHTEPGAVKRHGTEHHNGRQGWGANNATIEQNPNGAPPLDHWWHDDDFPQDAWDISTQPYSGSHYATWPEALCLKPILAMCPQRVCTVCGEPSRRIGGALTLDSYRQSSRPQTIKAVALADEAGLTDAHIAAVRAFGTSDAGKATTINNGAGHNREEVKVLAAEAKAVLGGYFREFVMSTNASAASTWSDCGHNAWRPGRVIDPFGGSGTTLRVAANHARDAIGIDLDDRNVHLARERVGMWFDHTTPDDLAAVLVREVETSWEPE